jgi:two-component system chemotaxis response regulator CheB
MFDGVLRVAVVDDSALYRRMILNVLGKIPGIDVVGTATHGSEAVELVTRTRPDVITLDVEMPGMDGIEVLRRLKVLGLPTRSIMVSSLTAAGAPATVAALMEGAFDFILKPAGVDSQASRTVILQELAEKIRAVRESMDAVLPAPTQPSAARPVPPPRPSPPPLAPPQASGRFDAIVIGTSTGGPQALRAVVPLLAAGLPVPVFVVQHIPPQFTTSLAERLDALSPMRVVVADDQMVVEPGCVYVAVGNRHLGVARRGEEVVCALDDGPRRRGCRPAVDHLLETAAVVYGRKLLVALLTGMGCDGLDGCRAVKAAGGIVLAQSAETCVVYGMPKAIQEAGLADEVVPLDRVAQRLQERLGDA